MHEFKFAIRSLLKTPIVTTIAVLSVALGIGANVAIFSIFNQMLLRPLPVEEPDRLVNLVSPGPRNGSSSCGQSGSATRCSATRCSGISRAARTSFTDNRRPSGSSERIRLSPDPQKAATGVWCRAVTFRCSASSRRPAACWGRAMSANRRWTTRGRPERGILAARFDLPAVRS